MDLWTLRKLGVDEWHIRTVSSLVDVWLNGELAFLTID